MKVSIITVCYNSVKTLEQTIQSVLNQSYKDIEYIIIDGASSDGTVDVIRKYEDRLAYWVSEPDNGLYCAMNKGLAVATGDIIGIINSDDWYANGAIERVALAFEEDAALGLTHGDVMMISSEGEEIYVKGISEDMEDITSWYPHPTVFVRRSVYLKYGIFDESYKLLADGEIMLRFKRLGVKTRKVGGLIAYFRVGGISSSNKNVYVYSREEKRLLTSMERIYSDDISSMEVIEARKNLLRKVRIVQYLSVRMGRGGNDDFYRNILMRKKK